MPSAPNMKAYHCCPSTTAVNASFSVPSSLERSQLGQPYHRVQFETIVENDRR